MKVLLILSLIILTNCTSPKQIVSSIPVETEEASTFREFHTLTYQAFLALADTNLMESVELYRQAFAKMEVDYVGPYFNAYQVASRIGDCEMSFYAAKQLLQFGSWMEHFQKNPCLYDDDYLWTELEYHFIADENMIPFHLEDSFGEWNKLDSLQQSKSNFLDSIEIEFLSLYEKYGFPSERLLGANWSLVGLIRQDYQKYAPLVQNSQTIYHIFTEALEKGQISPLEYALLFPTNEFFVQLQFVVLDPMSIRIFTFKDQELEALNKKRLKIGLPTVRDQAKALKTIELRARDLVPYDLRWIITQKVFKSLPTFQSSMEIDYINNGQIQIMKD